MMIIIIIIIIIVIETFALTSQHRMTVPQLDKNDRQTLSKMNMCVLLLVSTILVQSHDHVM